MLSRAELLKRIAADLAMLPSHLDKIIQTAPLRYKLFEIPKKSGGVREVAQPAREVKAIQRWVMREVGPMLPVHDSAMAYRPGRSILANAKAHADSRYMLKLDFKSFFPSILCADIARHLSIHCTTLLENDACELIAHVCSWAPLRQTPLRLCIGAPSSPILSNSILFEFDRRVASAAAKDGATYTRYADDVTISSRDRGVVDKYYYLVETILGELPYPRLTLNNKKTVRASRAGKRVVTGLTLTPEGNVSIGRERKRQIRAMYHRSLIGEFSESESQELSGLLAFADSIEPSFSYRLKKSVKP